MLTALETVLSTLVDAEGATRSGLTSAGAPEPLDRADRTIDTDVTRLATLTRDNPTQQAHVRQLRQNTTRTLAALRAQWDATRGARAASPVDAETARASLDAARATLRAMRTEENRLLAGRVQAEQSAGRRLQLVTFGLVTVAIALLGWLGWLFMRAARRQRRDTDALRDAKNDLTVRRRTRRSLHRHCPCEVGSVCVVFRIWMKISAPCECWSSRMNCSFAGRSLKRSPAPGMP